MQMQQDKHIKKLQRSELLGPVAIQFGSTFTGSWRIERPEIDISDCIKCGICERYCPANVISIYNDKDKIEIMWDYCKGCGICANECPKGCITMVNEGGGE